MGDFERLLGQYGQAVNVCFADGRVVAARAFLQPITERREQGTQEMPTPLGIMRRDRFLYLGEAGVSVEGLGGGYLCWANRKFSVEQVQGVFLGGALSHWRAVLTLRDEG